jgi:hypothetical protein
MGQNNLPKIVLQKFWNFRQKIAANILDLFSNLLKGQTKHSENSVYSVFPFIPYLKINF